MQTGVIKLEGHMFAKNLEIVLAYLARKATFPTVFPRSSARDSKRYAATASCREVGNDAISC